MQQALTILLIGGMAVQGWRNIQQQLAIMGEYSNPNQERLFQWIEKETKPSTRHFYHLIFGMRMKINNVKNIWRNAPITSSSF